MSPLDGARIWLSGSIPDEASVADQQRIRDFLSTFAKRVFQLNGTIVHGSHPTIRDTLLDAARWYRAKTNGDKAGLALVVSLYYSKEPGKYGIDLPAWNAVCREPVTETREALPDPGSQEVSQAASLAILRDRLREQSNAIVAVGGKWWATAVAKAGVPREVELARAHGLPLFLLGGLGGAAADYVQANASVLRGCRNGLSDADNLALAQVSNPTALAERVVDALTRLPLQVRSAQSGRPFRILCLDGGGILGAFTAAVLDHWEKATGRNVADHFDLIAGTSTGGILAVGLGLGLSAGDLLKFYHEEGPKIFATGGEARGLWLSFRHWFGSKFDREVLRAKIAEALARAGHAATTVTLEASRTRLVIPAYDAESDSIIVFRTPHGRGGAADAGRRCLDVALATAAAPTYFDPAEVGTFQVIDGGVWANSPTTVALAEAVYELGIAPERVEMLSVGTTYAPKLLGRPLLVDRPMIEALVKPFVRWPLAKLISFAWEPRRVRGKLGWLPTIAGFLMKTQAQTAAHVSGRILGDRFLRVDAPTVETEIDDVTSVKRLINLAREPAEANLAAVRTRFLNGLPVDPWQTTRR
jgi:uncharacterized protein